MTQKRGNESINAYVKFLQSKGIGQVLLDKHTLLLKKLSVNLDKRTLDGDEYREAIDLLMEKIPVDDWHASLTTAREFHPFWVQDIKAISRLNTNAGFDLESLTWKPLPASLKSLTESLVTEKFDVSENWLL